MMQKLRAIFYNFFNEVLGGSSKPPSQRRKEVRENLSDSSVTIDNKTYPVRNWSKSCCLVGPVDFSVTIGRRLDASFEISVADESMAFACRIGVIRVDSDENCFAASFLDLEDGDRKEIEGHFQSSPTD